MKTLQETLNDQELKMITGTLGQLSEREEQIIILVSELIHSRTMNFAKNINDHAEKLHKLTDKRISEIERNLDDKFEAQTKALKILLDERLPKK